MESDLRALSFRARRRYTLRAGSRARSYAGADLFLLSDFPEQEFFVAYL
jgi:hypothetical protein